jgi:hypothetical protein
VISKRKKRKDDITSREKKEEEKRKKDVRVTSVTVLISVRHLDHQINRRADRNQSLHLQIKQ